MITHNTSSPSAIAELTSKYDAAIATAQDSITVVQARKDLMPDAINAQVEFLNGYITGLRLAKSYLNY